MAPSFGKQTADCQLPYYWLMSLAMDLATPVEIYLQWRENQLAIQHIVDTMNYFQ